MAVDKLRAWIESQGTPQCDLAARLDISEQSISAWTGGTRQPSLKVARALEKLTKGAVRVLDWPRHAELAQEYHREARRASRRKRRGSTWGE